MNLFLFFYPWEGKQLLPNLPNLFKVTRSSFGETTAIKILSKCLGSSIFFFLHIGKNLRLIKNVFLKLIYSFINAFEISCQMYSRVSNLCLFSVSGQPISCASFYFNRMLSTAIFLYLVLNSSFNILVRFGKSL